MRKLFSILLLLPVAALADFNPKTDPNVYIDFTGTEDVAGMTRISSLKVDPNPSPFVIFESSLNTEVTITLTGSTRLWNNAGLRFYTDSSFEVKAPDGYVVTSVKVLTNRKAEAENFRASEGEYASSASLTAGPGDYGEASEGGEWVGEAMLVHFDYDASSTYTNVNGMVVVCKYSDTDAIETITGAVESDDDLFYDLSGRKIENPSHGIFIRSRGRGVGRIVRL